MDSSSEQSPAQKQAEYTLRQTFLGKMAQVHLDDGRTVEGRMVALDSAGNAILQNAKEWRRNSSQQVRDTKEQILRWLGMVALPAKHIVDIDVKASWAAPASDLQASSTLSTAPPLPPRGAPLNVFPTDSSLYT